MKIRSFLVILLLGAVLLAACTPPATVTPNPAQPDPGSLLPVESYPIAPQEAYPANGQDPALQEPGSIYPDLQSGDTIEWSMAQGFILAGEVDKVVQTHSLQVTLMLKDGRSMITTEPAIDVVLDVIDLCGDPCNSIEIVTE